ncbi:MAG: hypothetical protein PHD33_06260 [Atribacterota bacterium]|nr:hypothetical protein [Atribacterota bacterium]
MQKQREHYELSLKQQEMMEQELEISKKGLERHRSLLNKGGVSESQIEEAEARAIQSERSYTGFIASLKSAEITMINQREFFIIRLKIFVIKKRSSEAIENLLTTDIQDKGQKPDTITIKLPARTSLNKKKGGDTAKITQIRKGCQP